MTYIMHNIWNTISYLPLKPKLKQGLIGLARWPDFDAIEHRPEFNRLAAILAPRPMTAAQLQESSGYSEFEVHSFLNAASLDGFLEVISDRHPHGTRNVGVHFMAEKLRRAFHSLIRTH
jgi:hypothetical protein